MLFGVRKKDLRRANESLTWTLERTISILMERSQLPRETIEKWLEVETTLDADAALKCHLVDGIYGMETWLSIQGLNSKKCGGCQDGGCCGKKKSSKKAKKK
jgi:ATP-dependent protease ClpP protease subunit